MKKRTVSGWPTPVSEPHAEVEAPRRTVRPRSMLKGATADDVVACAREIAAQIELIATQTRNVLAHGESQPEYVADLVIDVVNHGFGNLKLHRLARLSAQYAMTEQEVPDQGTLYRLMARVRSDYAAGDQSEELKADIRLLQRLLLMHVIDHDGTLRD